jgi:hypothetical protein
LLLLFCPGSRNGNRQEVTELPTRRTKNRDPESWSWLITNDIINAAGSFTKVIAYEQV